MKKNYVRKTLRIHSATWNSRRNSFPSVGFGTKILTKPLKKTYKALKKNVKALRKSFNSSRLTFFTENDITNNFQYHNQLMKVHRFYSKSLWSWQNSAILTKKWFFSQLQRLIDRIRCTFRSWSRYTKLFILSFLTSFILIKTLSDRIWNHCARSKNHQILSLVNFGGSWRENSWKKEVYHRGISCLK